MATAFCDTCKPNTKKKCATCPRVKDPPKTQSSSYFAAIGPCIKVLGKTWWDLGDDITEEEVNRWLKGRQKRKTNKEKK